MDMKDEDMNEVETLAGDFCRKQLLNITDSKDKAAVEELLNEKIGLRIAEVQEDEYKKIRFDVCQLISNFNVQHNAVSGSSTSFFFDALMDDQAKILSKEECLRISERAANLQEGAVLDTFGYEKNGGYENFIARWRHEYNSMLVEKDFVHVVLNGRTGKVISIVNKWHNVDEQYGER